MITQLPTPSDIIKGELAQSADWIVANVSTFSMAWPTKVQKVVYSGADIWILPIMEGYFPAVATKKPTGSKREDAELLLMRFLSALCWAERDGVTVDHITGGNLPRQLGSDKRTGFVLRSEFDLVYLPEPKDEKGKLALALMREGRALRHPAYSFLSRFRAFELCVAGKRRQEWIETHLPLIENHRAKEQLKNLRASGVTNIGEHIYEARRCAIAHASEGQIIDPDDLSGSREVSLDLPIMDAIAELAIQKELGIQTRYTLYREHLYELAGFKKHFGEGFVRTVSQQTASPGGDYKIDIPNIDFGLLHSPPFKPFQKMSVVDAGFGAGVAQLVYRSQSGYFTIIFRLDFGNERLLFDIHNGVYSKPDDGSAAYAEEAADVNSLTKSYLGNGSITIHNSDTGELLSRVDPFIPVNVIVDFDYFKSEVERWKKLAEDRACL